MNTKILTQEQISAFADGEMPDSQVDLVLAALRRKEGRATWDAYHHIGDVLRSDEMAFELRPDFASRMTARLEQEPAIVAPKAGRAPAEQPEIASTGTIASGRFLRRLALPGMAAAAVATLALFSGPQLMVATKGRAVTDGPQVMIASASASVASSAGLRTVADSGTSQQDGAVLRDPRIDDYLLAHQRFSPSVFSTAQYARTATFSTDSNK